MPRRYPSGLLPADLAPDRQRKAPHADPVAKPDSATLARFPISPETYAVAIEKVTRLAPDLLEVLGLVEPQRQAARPGVGVLDVTCPSCKVPPRYRCKSKGGHPMRPHVPRVRLAEQGEAAERLIDEILTEA